MCVCVCVYVNERERDMINPYASIGRTGTSEVKVEVRDVCLESWYRLDFPVFSLQYEKKFKVFSKKRSPDISLHHKNKASYKFSKKKTFALGRKKGWR